MSTNYQRGANTERRVKRMLEDAGYMVFRTAGSHGTFDLAAVARDGSKVWLIQVKATPCGYVRPSTLRKWRVQVCQQKLNYMTFFPFMLVMDSSLKRWMIYDRNGVLFWEGRWAELALWCRATGR